MSALTQRVVAKRAIRTLPFRYSESELCHALELNQAEWLRHKRLLPWVEFRDHGDALRVFAGNGWPRNLVAHARFATDAARQRVGELLAPHLRQKVACNWLVGPLTTPPDLARHLRAHGFRCTAHDDGMACELRTPQPTLPAPKGVLIYHVDAPPALLPLTTELRRLRHHGRSLLARAEPKQIWNFTASVDDRPIGETTLFVGAGIAGIYDVGVTEEFRRRGIGTALVAAALDQARELGLSIAVLGATWMGQGLYERLGFRVVCKLSFWKYGKIRQIKGSDSHQRGKETR